MKGESCSVDMSEEVAEPNQATLASQPLLPFPLIHNRTTLGDKKLAQHYYTSIKRISNN